MRNLGLGFAALAALSLVATPASAQFLKPKPNCAPIIPLDCPPGASNPLMPNMGQNTNPNANIPNPENMAQENALQNAFAQGNEGGGTAPRAFNDNFNGDFNGLLVRKPVQVGSQTTVTGTGPFFVITTTPIFRDIVVPLGTRYNGILITDNDSPRPVDRVYFGYNYYNGIGTGANSGLDRVDMHRQTVGFEKTFADGNASFGLRLPFIQTTAPVGFGQSNVGDLSVLLKYAFYNDRATGDVASVGMVVTAPTGGGNNFVLFDGTTPPNDVLLQPWLGGVKMFDRGYVQGITSFVVPTDSRDPLLFNNSAALGYFLYQNATDRFLNAIVPNLELHVRTPLNHRSTDEAIYFQDQVNMTAGVHFRTTRATISPAFTLPLASPLPYNGEFNLMVNIRF